MDARRSDGGKGRGVREFKVGGVRKRVFATNCPDMPDEYCDENFGWAWANVKNVAEWIDELERSIDACCQSNLAGAPITPPTGSCDDWDDAWAELRTFGKSIRPRLKAAEDQFRKCSGEKIEAAVPVPKPGKLPGPAQHKHVQACARARHYFGKFKAWGDEIRGKINDHCEDTHPTHLSPPPDPPF